MKNITRRILIVLGYILGVYLVLRAAVEPFIIDYGNPESYRQLWGGPTVAGVIVVHMLPGVIALIFIVSHIRKVRKARNSERR